MVRTSSRRASLRSYRQFCDANAASSADTGTPCNYRARFLVSARSRRAPGAARTRLERGLGIGAGVAPHARNDLFLRVVGADPAGDAHPLAGLEVFVMR